jgi:hypothetical protein
MFAKRRRLSRQRILQLIAAGRIHPKPEKQPLSGIYLIEQTATILRGKHEH